MSKDTPNPGSVVVSDLYDKRGIPIMCGDVVKVFHFVGVRRKRHYMYKQCVGVHSYPNGGEKYMFFSHLNFKTDPAERDGPYHERLGRKLEHYEIVQSIKCDHEERPRRPQQPEANGGNG